MELRHLKYFIVAAEEEHISHAARRLHLTQPALSAQIRELEEELEVSLFERLPRGVRLTYAGRVFLEQARRILAQVEEARERSRHAQRGEVGRLRLALNELSGQRPIVADSFRLFRARYPNVELELTELTTFQQIEALRLGNIDAGFQYRQGSALDAIEYLDLYTDEYLLGLPKHHRFTRRRAVSLAQLAEEPFVWMHPSVHPALNDQLRAFLRAKGFSPKIVQEVRTDASMLNLVCAGIGIGLFVSASRSRVPKTMVFRPIEDMRIPLHLCLAWQKHDPSPMLARFLEVVRSLKLGGAEKASKR